MNKATLFSFIRIIAMALITELVVFNFSTLKSLLYHDSIVFNEITVEGAYEISEGSGKYVALDEGITFHIVGIDQKLHNIFLGIETSGDHVVSCTMMLTDEGNYYPYTLPEKTIVPGVRKSYYTNIYPSGKVGNIDVQLTLPAGSEVTLGEISGNVPVPPMFSFARFLFIAGVLLLFHLAAHTDQWKDIICRDTGKQFFAAAAVMAALIGMAWTLLHINPICIASPWPHQKQYQELVEVMAEGHFYLDTEPSEALLNVENPYDTIYLQANGIDYLADYSYYSGKYYVYFGVVPELLLYFPYYMLTGFHLPNYIAVFLFYCGFILTVFALYREIIRSWFPHTPYFLYLMTCILTVCCGNYLFLIARPDLYDVPLMAATMFTTGGLWLWIKGKHLEAHRYRRLCYFLGSLCMALVAGCRPQMLLFSLLALPLFWKDLKEILGTISAHKSAKQIIAADPGRKLLIDALFLCFPYILTAVGIMYYNAARFGSVADFGATYSLTSNDMTKRSFNLSQALLGLWHYFLRPPVVESDFPFLQGIQISSGSYMGKLNAEYTYGGILASNAFLWILLYMKHGKDLLKKKGIYVFSLLSIVISVILGVVDVTAAGILQRYMTDMIWGIWLAAVLFLLAYTERAIEYGKLKLLMLSLTMLCLLQAAYGFGVILGNGDLGVNVRIANPGLYYYLRELFRF